MAKAVPSSGTSSSTTGAASGWQDTRNSPVSRIVPSGSCQNSENVSDCSTRARAVRDTPSFPAASGSSPYSSPATDRPVSGQASRRRWNSNSAPPGMEIGKSSGSCVPITTVSRPSTCACTNVSASSGNNRKSMGAVGVPSTRNSSENAESWAGTSTCHTVASLAAQGSSVLSSSTVSTAFTAVAGARLRRTVARNGRPARTQRSSGSIATTCSGSAPPVPNRRPT